MTDEELPSDRALRQYVRGFLYVIGVCCLVGATIALLDGKPAHAAAGAAVGLVWIIGARLMVPF